MNKKLFLSATILLSLVLTGCNTNKNSSAPSSDSPVISSSEEGPVVPDPDVIPDSFEEEIKTAVSELALFKKDTQQIVAYPDFRTPMNNLKFISRNPSIASVDENGLVTAVDVGETEIMVRDLNRASAGKFLKVSVVEKLAAAKTTALYNTMQPYATAEHMDNFEDHEFYEKTVYKNGVLKTYDLWDQTLVYSQEHAYFRVYETDVERRVNGGADSFSSLDWIFYTNEYFDTYTFHSQGIQNNYFVAATQAYIGEDQTEPMLEVLDNIFVSGRKIFTQAFEHESESGTAPGMYTLNNVLDYATKNYSNIKNKKTGSTGPGNAIFSCRINYSDSTADTDDESRYGIPYGTVIKASSETKYIIENFQVVGEQNVITQTYSFGGDDYTEVINSNHVITRYADPENDLYYPDKEQYTLVDYLFAV